MSKITKLEIPLDPVPASRPRVTTEKYLVNGKIVRKNMTYYSKRYSQFRKDLEELYNLGFFRGVEKISGLVSVRIGFFIKAPKTRQKDIGKFCDKYDLDNLEKAVLDFLNGKFIDDDRYVVELSSRKIWDKTGKIEISIVKL